MVVHDPAYQGFNVLTSCHVVDFGSKKKIESADVTSLINLITLRTIYQNPQVMRFCFTDRLYFDYILILL